MMLIINICKEQLHYFEFVKPIGNILSRNNIEFITKHYKELTFEDVRKSKRIIICGTSLKDNEFLENEKLFEWLLIYDRPLLGICGGIELIGKVFGGKIKNKQEIGLNEIDFEKPFLGLKEKNKVYQLHNFYVDISNVKDIEIYSRSYFNIPQAIKHKSKPIYGVLFHPEVRNKGLVEEFCKL